MANGDGDATRLGAGRVTAQPAGSSGSTALVPVQTALHQMHNGRVVSHAGRMVAGSLVPVPSAKMVHSRPSGKRWQTTAGIAAAAFVFTLGTFALFAGAINKNRMSQEDANASGATASMPAGATATASTPARNAPVQTMAVSEVRTTAPKPEFTDTPLRTKPKPALTTIAPAASNLSIKNLSGTGGEALPVRVSVQRGQSEDYSFVMFRGVPKDVAFSSGFSVKGTWMVALHDLDRLTLTAPAGFDGVFNLEVVLIKGQNTPAEKQRMAVTIRKPALAAPTESAPKPETARLENAATPPQLVTASIQPVQKAAIAPARQSRAVSAMSAPRQSAMAPAQESAILDKAAVLIGANDVSGARLLFEYAANRGSSKAALAMGQTFDPAFFRTAEIIGMRPDAEKAKEWYQKAADLGNTEAANRLSALETTQ